MRQDFGPVTRYWKQGLFSSILACKFSKTVSRGEIFKTWASCLHVNGKTEFSITMMSYWYIIILPVLCMLCNGCNNCASILLAFSCGWTKIIIQIGYACMHAYFFWKRRKKSPLSKISRCVCTGRAFILVCY